MQTKIKKTRTLSEHAARRPINMPYGRAKDIFKIIYLRKRVVRDPDPDAFELESIEWHRQMRLQEE